MTKLIADKFQPKQLSTWTKNGITKFRIITAQICNFSAHQANVDLERVFSSINAQRTKYRNRLNIATVKSIILCAANHNLSCGNLFQQETF
jgi:hypothetical protein